MLQVEGTAQTKVLGWDGRTERKLGVSNAAKAWESVPCRMRPESAGPHLQDSRAKERAGTHRQQS